MKFSFFFKFPISHKRLMPVSIMKIEWYVSFWIEDISEIIEKIGCRYLFMFWYGIKIW